MSPSSPKTERYFKDRYTTRYLIAFGLIAATVIAGAFQLYRVLEINHEQAEILQVAGAQGKLSQRLALLTPRVIEAPNAFRQKRALNDMRVAVELMRAGHSFLTSPNERGIIPAQSSPELIHHYAPEGRGLERMAESFIEAFERFLDDPVGMENTIEFHRVNAETGLLVRLNQAMGLYGDVARQMNRDAINLLILWVALALLLLVVEIAFIFNPMARDAARSMAKMSAELDERTSLLSRSLRIANMGHWRAVNRDSDPIWLSRELLDMYGMEREEGFVPLAVIQEGDVIAEDTAIEDNTQHVAFKRTWETGEPTVAQSMYRKPNGEIIEMLVHMAAEKDDDGNVSAVTGVIRDVTEEAKADRALRDSLGLVKDKSASLEEAQRLARSGSWRRPLDVDKLEMDGRCYELLKFDPGTLNTRRSDMQVHYLEDDFSRVVELQQKTEETGEEQQIDVRMRRGDGVVIDMRIRMKLERDVDGKATALFGTMQDVSTEKSAERELQQLAFYDNLTGLANRTLFKRELARCCEEASEGIGEAALLLLDLDNFKEVNDTLGHLAGDHLLEVVGRRLKAIVPTADFVSRLGGDEFAVIVRSNLQRSEIEDLCEKIDHSISLPADLGVGEVETSVSIGIAATPEHSIEPDELMRFADLALYKAKENGKGRRSHFAPELSSAMTARLSLANEIRSALAEDRFEVHYQPIIGAADGMVEGFEALLRLPRADGTYIPPGQFVPIAESSHLIAELGSFVLHRACREAQSWIDAGIRPRRVSVNVSAAQLWHGDVEKVIDSALSSSGLDPENLCIELTETVFAADFLDRLEGILKRLSDNGVCLALDDFGTGYSSLSYLNRLPFDRLKIDRAFITDAQLCEERIKLLRGIVELGKGLNMSVVAEGVETADELSLVTDADCDLLQGWYFGRAERSDVAIREAASIEAKATANRLAEKRPVHPVGDAVLAAMLSGHRA